MPQRIGSFRWFVFVLFLWSIPLIATGCAPGEREATATPEIESTFADEGPPSPSPILWGMVSVCLHMHEGMGGPHHFLITIRSNDPLEPEKILSLRAYFGD